MQRTQRKNALRRQEQEVVKVRGERKIKKKTTRGKLK